MGVRLTRCSVILAAACVSISTYAPAAEYYFGGYDTTNSIQGTPDLPVSSAFTVAGQAALYSDAAGASPYAAGTTIGSSSSNEILFGGTSAATAYTADGPTGSGAVVIHGITLGSSNTGLNTLNFNFNSASGGCYSIGSGGTGTINGVGITLNGTSDWKLVNKGGSNSPLRLQNSSSIAGTGTGTLTIPFNIADQSGAPSLSVNLTGGGTVAFTANNDFGSNTATAPAQFTLTKGTVDFQSIRPFGNSRNQVRLNGGTLTSSTGTTISTVYTGTAQTGTAGGVLIGGDLTFAGTTSWSLGTSAVTLAASHIINANNTGTTGATVAGIISEATVGSGITVASTSLTPGTLTLTGANTYTGATTITTGNLVLGPNAQTTVLNPANTAGGADLQGTGTMKLSYTAGNSPVAAIQTLLNTEYATNGGNFTTGQIRSSNGVATSRTIGYSDNGTDTVTLRQTLPGDANLDGVVNFSDFLLLQANFGGSGTTFGQGNFNYDGQTDFSDFLLLQSNFGSSINGTAVTVTASQVEAMNAFAASVPEPTSVAALAAVGLIGLRRRRSVAE